MAKTACVLWDVDGTLVEPYMQSCLLLPWLETNAENFFTEVNRISKQFHADGVQVYLQLLIAQADKADIPFTRQLLESSGRYLTYYGGATVIQQFFARATQFALTHGVNLRHYAVSSGNAEIIRGSVLGGIMTQIHASSYNFNEDGSLYRPAPIGIALNPSEKTGAVYRISKGLEPWDFRGVNQYMPIRPNPIERMLVVADGETDVPMMRVVKEGGGEAVAVYDPRNEKACSACMELYADKRVSNIAPTDYTEGSPLDMLMRGFILRMARH